MKKYLSLALLTIGVVMLITVFYLALKAYSDYKGVNIENAENTTSLLAISTKTIADLLVKIAYLGVALASGTVFLRYGVQLLRAESPSLKEEQRKSSEQR